MRVAFVFVALMLASCGGRVESDVNAGGSTGCTDVSQNPFHCGRCGHSCQGGTCTGGVCQPVMLRYLGNIAATALALDDDRIYWASPVQSMPKQGGQITLLADAPQDLWGIAVDDSTVAWTDLNWLWVIPKEGGSAAHIGVGGYRVALDNQYVYTAWYGVWRYAKNGGTAEQLAQDGGEGIAVDADSVYFTTWSPGGAWRVPKTGGTPSLIGKADYSAYITTYGDKVYWTSQGSSGVLSASKSGGNQVEVASASTPYGIAADAVGVYWTEFDTGNIWMLPTGASTPIVLASGQFYPRDLAVDETAVYWTDDPSNSTITKVAKP